VNKSSKSKGREANINTQPITELHYSAIQLIEAKVSTTQVDM
jgi:hypothetical protein